MSLDQIKRDKKGRFTKDSYFAYWKGKKMPEYLVKKLSEVQGPRQRGIKKNLTPKQYKERCKALGKEQKKKRGTHLSEKMKDIIKKSNIEHNDECAKLKQELEKQGFKAIDINALKPDIIAVKDGKIYAYEVEFQNPKYEKYNECSFFNDIIWVLKSRKKNYTVIRSNNGAILSAQLPA